LRHSVELTASAAVSYLIPQVAGGRSPWAVTFTARHIDEYIFSVLAYCAHLLYYRYSLHRLEIVFFFFGLSRASLF